MKKYGMSHSYNKQAKGGNPNNVVRKTGSSVASGSVKPNVTKGHSVASGSVMGKQNPGYHYK